MVWLPCERDIEDDTRIPYELVNPHPYLGSDEPSVGRLQIESNPIRDRYFGRGMVQWALRKEGYSIILLFRDAFSIDGSAINRSILESVGTSGVPAHQWRGPMAAVRQTPSEFYEDITLDDFRHIIDHVISYATTELRESTSNLEEDHVSTTIRGVKICCYRETKLHGSEPYISVDVPIFHPTRLLYKEGKVSPISELLGLPLRLWKYLDIATWIDPPGWDENKNAASNQDAAFLMMETDSGNPGWGWAPLYWNSNIGNVLAIRPDGKDLAVHDVRLMCYFARRKLQPMFEDALGAGWVPRTKQEVLDFITWENMMKCKDEIVDSDDTDIAH